MNKCAKNYVKDIPILMKILDKITYDLWTIKLNF